MDERTEEKVSAALNDPDRRDLFKLGIGAAMTMLGAETTSAQSKNPNAGTVTRTGWKNTAQRASGNGPMDNTTRQIVQYVSSFSEAKLTPALVEALGNTMVDSIASLIAGFESEPARICARMARTIRSDLKCTVLGYGITTSPEMATFANGCMLRHADFNDIGPGGHVSDIISGILAVGEAMHSTGPEVLAAVALGYELAAGIPSGTESAGWDAPFEGPATAMAAGKLMGLNEDQLANALSLTLVPHMPMSVTHVGALSHWKGCHSSEAVRCAVFSTLLAREGMTGPSQPFEARQGLWDHLGPGTAPSRARTGRENGGAENELQALSFRRVHTVGAGADACNQGVDQSRRCRVHSCGSAFQRMAGNRGPAKMGPAES
jgi:2-methylcitrate dehydratase PrpD